MLITQSTFFKPILLILKPVEDILSQLETPLQMSPPVMTFSPNLVKNMIHTNMFPKKTPGYYSLAKYCTNYEGEVFLLLQQYLMQSLDIIILVGKPPNELTSYRPISSLPLLSKLFEKLLVVQASARPPIWISGTVHPTVDQIHRVTDVISKIIEGKCRCSATFIDISQAFDKVQYTRLLTKIENNVPHPYFLILTSYLEARHFQVQIQELTKLYPIRYGVPHGSVLGFILYCSLTN